MPANHVRVKGVLSTKKMIVPVTPEEHAAHHALADYLGTNLAELIRRLLDAERARIVATGRRPPRR